MLLKSFKKIHIVGIGGIGMSALAGIVKSYGFLVQGSNASENKNVIRLRSMGVEVFVGHSIQPLKGGVDLIVYSTAVPQDNVELQYGFENGITVMNRATFLKAILTGKEVISITGTNGKTTVTSLVGHIMIHAMRDPTVITGGVMHENGSNFVVGGSNLCVLEADESDGTFLQIDSHVGLVTNIANDHSNFYGSYADLVKAFYAFCKANAARGGLFIDKSIFQQIDLPIPGKVITFSIEDGSADFSIKDETLNSSGGFDFIVKAPGGQLLPFSSPLVGKYNISNALSAIVVAMHYGIDYQVIKDAIATFKGVEHRFQLLGNYNGCKVIDDYAHHPSAIEECIIGAKALVGSKGRVFAVIEPHRYTRVKANFVDYVRVLKLPDYAFLMEINPGGEQEIDGATSADILEALWGDGDTHDNVFFAKDFDAFISTLEHHLRPRDLLLFMGAGTITRWAVKLTQGVCAGC